MNQASAWLFERARRGSTAALLGIAALAACSSARTPAPPPAPPQVSVVTVHRQSVPVVTELPGRTSAYLVAQVRARVDGIVLQRAFKEGSDVKAGQTLYQIDPKPAQAALDNAIAAEQKAQATLVSATALAERDKILLAGNGVAQQDYDNAIAAQGQAAADLASAKAMVEQARLTLGYTTVTSPISGRTGVSAVTPGAYVQASAATLMTTAQQINPIYVDLNQSSLQGLQLRRDIASGRIKPNGPNGTKVTLLLEDGTQYKETGGLQFSDITVDQNTGSVTVRAVFPNRDYLLLPGMFVRARIEQGVNEGAILVPQVGVTHDPQGRATTLVVDEKNQVQQRVVEAARTLGDQWVVQSGLNDGDRVIVSGLQKVKPGITVTAAEAPVKTASAS